MSTGMEGKTPKDRPWALEEKWGPTTLKAGWIGIPSILLDQQAELGLMSRDVVVLAHLIRWWWVKGRWPYPSLDLVAKSMGLDERMVRSSVERMKEMELIAEIEQSGKPPAYDLTGLVAVLEEATERRLRREVT